MPSDRIAAERAVIEAAREWARGARTMPETMEEIARDGALYDALEALNTLPPETPAEKAQWVREALADEEVVAAYIALTSDKRRERVVALASETIAQEGRDDG